MKALPRLVTLLFLMALAAALVRAVLNLPPPAVDLPAAVAANLVQSGVEHPVTAVLLNFRGYDTLLEVAVLLIALLGVMAVAQPTQQDPDKDDANPVLQTLARLLAPLLVLAAGYLLWAGGHRPGGAFQAAALLAGAVVLLRLAGLLPAWPQPHWVLRLGVVAGFFVFLGVAVLGQGALLAYPPNLAGGLILLIEAGLTLSLGLILAGLYLAFAADRGKS